MMKSLFPGMDPYLEQHWGDVHTRSTTNLWPALEAMYALEDEGAFVDDRLDLTDEGPAPEEIGGYLVGYRMFFRDSGTAHTMEGFFHLVDYEGVWKVEDWYMSLVDRQALPEPVSIAANYREIFSLESPESGALTATPPSLVDSTARYLDEHPETVRTAERAVGYGVFSLIRRSGKVIGVGAVAVILAILSAIGRAVTGGKSAE